MWQYAGKLFALLTYGTRSLRFNILTMRLQAISPKCQLYPSKSVVFAKKTTTASMSLCGLHCRGKIVRKSISPIAGKNFAIPYLFP